jgi:HK97 gp10 family phage protein
LGDGIAITKVQGLQEMLRRLDQVPLSLSRDVAREGLTAAGQVLLDSAEEEAPRKTGELEEDLIMEVRVSSDLRTSRVSVGPGYDRAKLRTRTRGKFAGRVDTSTSPAVYGKFVETGHGKPGQSWASRYGSARQRRRTGKQIELGTHDVPPHPWLKPSFDRSKDQAVDVLLTHTRDALQRIDVLTR